ncbi:UvrD-helicase domain-containing protein, partial [uncultured Adlercreutzia sp.]|uniref:UvrD-helicase domain-containing protein n=1 Tax=uncultured Adlercreutzia sp. TaxID=875803 RepID=UPI0025A57474
TTATFGAKRDEAAFFEGYRAEYVRLADEVEGALGQRDARAILAVARLVDEEFRALKGPSRLDSGDLLRRCLEALRDHGVIAERYRRRFRLIMVDEFQDTDKVQVEVIRMLAAPDGRNICVVGDAQQSIYRFRGADVNVFFDYRDALRATDPRAHFPQLNSNFRSHGDVLAAVEKVFSQPEAFGADFLRLEAAGKVNREAD